MREIVAAENIVVDYGRGPILKGLNLSIPGPGLFGVLGPNGAGKTTLLNLLEGLSQPQSGQIHLFGQPLLRTGYPRQRVGVVLQRECAFQAIRVGEYAELFAALHQVQDGQEQILRQARLTNRAHQPLSSLSGGEAQRLFLWAATVHSPELLFLDEPTAQLDPEGKIEIGQCLKAMAANQTVVMTTHDLQEAEALFDRVAFLVDGEIKAAGPVHELKAGDHSLEETFFRHCRTRISPAGETL